MVTPFKARLNRWVWYLRNLRNLFIACVRIFFYAFIHPRKVGSLLFGFFASINEFYQHSHGRLRNFTDTAFYKKIVDDFVFVRCNVINPEYVVTRSGETQTIASIVKELNPKTIFEIGTYNGFTTLHFACNTKEDTKIYTLDLPPDFHLGKKEKTDYSYDDQLVVELSLKNINNRIYKRFPEGKKIVDLFGDSQSFDYSPYYGKMDLVFIDGNHSYEFVKTDTENAFKMLSPNGVILWHDYDYIIHRDVFKYLNQMSKSYPIYSVPGTRFAVYGKNLK